MESNQEARFSQMRKILFDKAEALHNEFGRVYVLVFSPDGTPFIFGDVEIFKPENFRGFEFSEINDRRGMVFKGARIPDDIPGGNQEMATGKSKPKDSFGHLRKRLFNKADAMEKEFSGQVHVLAFSPIGRPFIFGNVEIFKPENFRGYDVSAINRNNMVTKGAKVPDYIQSGSQVMATGGGGDVPSPGGGSRVMTTSAGRTGVVEQDRRVYPLQQEQDPKILSDTRRLEIPLAEYPWVNFAAHMVHFRWKVKAATGCVVLTPYQHQDDGQPDHVTILAEFPGHMVQEQLQKAEEMIQSFFKDFAS